MSCSRDQLKYKGQSIEVDACAADLLDGRVLIVDASKATVFGISKQGEITIVGPSQPSGKEGKIPITGLWADDTTLYIGDGGREPGLYAYDVLSNSWIEHKLGMGIYDVAFTDSLVVVVPTPVSLERVPRIILLDKGFRELGNWGERCPANVSTSDLLVQLACLNRIAAAGQNRVGLASLNTGECFVLDLRDRTIDSFREEDSTWMVPKRDGDKKLSFEIVILDIGVDFALGQTYVLTSPKGRYGRHVLEVYVAWQLVDTLKLSHEYETVVVLGQGALALVNESPAPRVDIYSYEPSSQ